jgi:hypothetical protein
MSEPWLSGTGNAIWRGSTAANHRPVMLYMVALPMRGAPSAREKSLSAETFSVLCREESSLSVDVTHWSLTQAGVDSAKCFTLSGIGRPVGSHALQGAPCALQRAEAPASLCPERVHADYEFALADDKFIIGLES